MWGLGWIDDGRLGCMLRNGQVRFNNSSNEHLKMQDSLNLYKILMLHQTRFKGDAKGVAYDK